MSLVPKQLLVLYGLIVNKHKGKFLQIRITYKIIALTLAFLMFFTSFGFSLDIHYCQNEIQSYSVIGKAKSCDKLADHNCDHASQKCHKATSDDQNLSYDHSKISDKECDKECCQNRSFHVENLDEDSLSSINSSFDLNQMQFVLAYVYSLYNVSVFKGNAVSNFSTYSPPLIEKDIQLLFQSFLL